MPRKIIYQCAVSLDGFIEDQDGQFDWCFTESEYDMQAFLATIDTCLYGRKSYELMIRMGQEFDPGMRHLVFASHLDHVAPNVEWIRGDAVEPVRILREEEGKDIWLFGGALLAGALANAGLVDELQLAVHPVVLGGGTSLFKRLSRRLSYYPGSIVTYADGLSMMTYSLRS